MHVGTCSCQFTYYLFNFAMYANFSGVCNDDVMRTQMKWVNSFHNKCKRRRKWERMDVWEWVKERQFLGNSPEDSVPTTIDNQIKSGNLFRGLVPNFIIIFATSFLTLPRLPNNLLVLSNYWNVLIKRCPVFCKQGTISRITFLPESISFFSGNSKREMGQSHCRIRLNSIQQGR